MNGDELRLIERCLANDRSAQHNLYQQFAPRMYSICLRYCRSAELAQDALQDGFIRVFRNLNQFRFECPLEFWIRRIIINSALKTIERENRLDLKFNQDDHDVISNHIQPVDTFDLEIIKKAIDRLPDGFRTVFYLFAIDGLTHKEIAKLLSISEGTSKSQYSRARKRLQENLKTIYPEYSAEI